MKIKYYTVTLNFDDITGWLNLEGSGISIEFRINEDERNQILSYLEEIKKIDDILLNPPLPPIGATNKLLENNIIDSTTPESLDYFWKVVNEVFLGPYRVLLNHAGETEKQRKALRDFFKPIRFRLRSTQKVMEIENKININTKLDEII